MCEMQLWCEFSASEGRFPNFDVTESSIQLGLMRDNSVKYRLFTGRCAEGHATSESTDTHAAANGVRDDLAPEPVLVPGTHSLSVRTSCFATTEPAGFSGDRGRRHHAGPGLGGVRWMAYPSFDVATGGSLRLSRVMTLKNALANIPLAEPGGHPATESR